MNKYKRLKAELRRKKVNYEDIARILNRSVSYVSKCFSMENKYFSIAEAYAILYFLGKPPETINYFFKT